MTFPTSVSVNKKVMLISWGFYQLKDDFWKLWNMTSSLSKEVGKQYFGVTGKKNSET